MSGDLGFGHPQREAGHRETIVFNTHVDKDLDKRMNGKFSLSHGGL